MNIKSTNNINFHNSFYGRRPNDFTYQLIKNPDLAREPHEKREAQNFPKQFPDWENDSYWLHRTKQDTISARVIGPYHMGALELDIPPGANVLFSTALLIFISTNFLFDKTNYQKLGKYEKILFPITMPFLLLMAISEAKYILTGRTLFEKKKTSNAKNLLNSANTLSSSYSLMDSYYPYKSKQGS